MSSSNFNPAEVSSRMLSAFLLTPSLHTVKGRKGETTNHFNGTTKKSTNDRSSNNNRRGGTNVLEMPSIANT